MSVLYLKIYQDAESVRRCLEISIVQSMRSGGHPQLKSTSVADLLSDD